MVLRIYVKLIKAYDMHANSFFLGKYCHSDSMARSHDFTSQFFTCTKKSARTTTQLSPLNVLGGKTRSTAVCKQNTADHHGSKRKRRPSRVQRRSGPTTRRLQYLTAILHPTGHTRVTTMPPELPRTYVLHPWTRNEFISYLYCLNLLVCRAVPSALGINTNGANHTQIPRVHFFLGCVLYVLHNACAWLYVRGCLPSPRSRPPLPPSWSGASVEDRDNHVMHVEVTNALASPP